MKIHLIYNPVSGKKNDSTIIQQIVKCAKKHNVELVTYQSQSPKDIGELTKKFTSSNTPTNLMVMGGDGSAHDALNGIVNFEKTNLYILPGGSGNDFFRELGWNTKDSLVDVFEKLITKARIKKADYFLLNNKYRCLNEISFGMSTDILYCRAKMKHFKPQTQYTIAMFKKGLFYTNYEFDLFYPETKKYDKIIGPFLTFGNGQYSGGGLKTAPRSKIDDGLITVSAIKKFPRICILPVLLSVKRGTIDRSKHHLCRHVKEVDVVIKKGVVSSDGVLFEKLKKLNIKVMPKKLNLAVLN